jgi:TRAP-type mannitol/chloroaromatic compound transport system permease small subunit
MEEFARSLGLGPTLWVYDMSRMIAGVLFMAAAGYGLMRGVHIRADFLYRGWSDKTQATVDALLYLMFFMPSMIFFTWVSAEFWWKAYSTGETLALDSAWQPILWPARLAMPIGGLLLALQGIPEIFRAFHKMGKERERIFVRFLPVYIIALIWLVLAVFTPDIVPGGAWFTDVMSAHPNIDKATIGLIMLGAMLFVIFIGFPISFTLIFLAFVFGIWGANFKLTTLLMTLNTNSTMLNDQLMAVPLFVLMGIGMEQAGLMERLFASIQMIMARIRGALFIAVLIVSTIFAAATGIVGASVTLLGIMAGATMSRSGYNVKLAAGCITAGGTLGILIPPSIMLIVMGPVLEVSTLDLFRGAFIPGALLASLYLLYTLGRCWIDPSLGPILSEEDQPDTSKFYGAEVALICLGILTVCRVFGLVAKRVAGRDPIWRLDHLGGDLRGGLCSVQKRGGAEDRAAHRGAVPSGHDRGEPGRLADHLRGVHRALGRAGAPDLWPRGRELLLLGPLDRVLRGPDAADDPDQLRAGLDPLGPRDPRRGRRDGCVRRDPLVAGLPPVHAAGLL